MRLDPSSQLAMRVLSASAAGLRRSQSARRARSGSDSLWRPLPSTPLQMDLSAAHARGSEQRQAPANGTSRWCGAGDGALRGARKGAATAAGRCVRGSRPPSSSPREIDQSSLLIPSCRVGYRRPKPVGIAPAPSSPLLLYTHPKGLMVRGGVRWLLLSAQTRAPHAIGHPAPVWLRGELLEGAAHARHAGKSGARCARIDNSLAVYYPLNRGETHVTFGRGRFSIENGLAASASLDCVPW